MSTGPSEILPLPINGYTVPSYYTRLDPILGSNLPGNVIAAGSTSVTITGITDAPPGTGQNGTGVGVYLLGYNTPGQTDTFDTPIYAQASAAPAIDLNTKDSAGNELYSWSATLNVAGLGAGLYELQSVVDFGYPVSDGNGGYTVDQVNETNHQQLAYSLNPYQNAIYTDHSDEAVVSVVANDQQTTITIAAGSAQISSDGRYVVYNAGDTYERDLQTGAVVDLTTVGVPATGILETDHYPVQTYPAFVPQTFVAGGKTFSSIDDYDWNPLYSEFNPLPTVTQNGVTTVIGGLGDYRYNVGDALAASDSGGVVLSGTNIEVPHFAVGQAYGTESDGQFYVTFLNPAPALTAERVPSDGDFFLRAGPNGTVTLSGTSDAIGQTVEVDIGQAGAEAATATVMPDGTWTAILTVASYTGPKTAWVSVSSTAGTPTLLTGAFDVVPLPTTPVLLPLGGPTNQPPFYLNGTATIGDTIDVYDGTTLIGTAVATPTSYGATTGTFTVYPGQVFTEGVHSLTATAIDVGGTSAPSAAVLLTIDLTPPTEAVATLVVAGNDVITLADQALPTMIVTGTLSAPLAAGDSVVVTTVGGQMITATATVGSRSFSASVPTAGGAGSLSAQVLDDAGNASAALSQAYSYATIRTVTQLTSARPGALSTNPSLSTNGQLAAFADGSENVVDNDIPQSGSDPGPIQDPISNPETVYLTNLVTGATIDASGGLANTSAPHLSGDGSRLVLSSQAPGSYQNQIEFVNLATGTTALLSHAVGAPTTPGDQSSQGAAISEDGHWAVFDSASGNLGSGTEYLEEVYEVNLDTGARRIVSTGANGLADNYANQASVSDDGHVVVFQSGADTLVPGTTIGVPEIYAVTYDATGVGTIQLVSTNAAGAVPENDAGAETPAISGSGRYVLFSSSGDNLVPGVTAGMTELFRKDLLTGAIVLVSADATGAPATTSVSGGSISDDGSKVAFVTDAPNLLGSAAYSAAGQDQAVVKNLDTGAISIVSGAGLRGADGSTQDATISGAGTVVAIDSAAADLVGAAPTSDTTAYVTGPAGVLAKPDDLSGDGHSDVVLQNVNGATVDFTLDTTGAVVAGTSLGSFGPGYQVVGTGDFYGDGTSDVVVEGPNTSITVFTVRDTAYTAGSYLGAFGPGWSFSGTGDFNGDGRSDILLSNANGSVVAFTMSGGQVANGTSFGNLGTSKVVGVGDFYGNGTSDELVQTADGTLVEFQVQNDAFVSGSVVGNFAGYHVAGVGDFDGDGRADILVQNTTSGAAVIFNMDGGAVTKGTYLGTLGGGAVVATGDYDGDGTSDILTQSTTGALVEFRIVNDAIVAGISLGNPGTAWHAVTPELPGSIIAGMQLSLADVPKAAFAVPMPAATGSIAPDPTAAAMIVPADPITAFA